VDEIDAVATNKYLRGGHGDGVDVELSAACQPRRRREEEDDDFFF
jgi:hypothetical protein